MWVYGLNVLSPSYVTCDIGPFGSSGFLPEFFVSRDW